MVVLGLLAWGVVALAGLFGANADPDAAGGVAAPSSAGSSVSTSSGSASASPSGAEGSPSASASEETAPEDCGAGNISVTADTDQSAYGANEDPVLVMSIENTGDAECTVNVGTAEQEFTVVSGSDRIFSTVDCLAEATDVEVSIAAGKTETARFTWERLRSAPGCKTVEAKPRPGTYVFTAKLGETASNRAPFTLQ